MAEVTKIKMAMIKTIHRTEIKKIVASTNVSETEALLSLPALRLDGQNIGVIENLEPFDVIQELYLHYNLIRTIENVDFLTKLRVLSLAHNQITMISNIAHLKCLEILDVSFNKIEVKDEALQEEKTDILAILQPIAKCLPKSIQIFDLRSNLIAVNYQAVLRSLLIRRLPYSRFIDGEVVTFQERQKVLSEHDEYLSWCSGAGQERKHVLFVELNAEFENEVDRKVQLNFCDGDDLDVLIPDFCREHNITGEDAQVRIRKEMVELIDDVAPSRFSLGRERSSQNSSQTKESASDLGSFTSRIERFYSKYDPSKVDNAATVAAKYGQSRAGQDKLMEALVTKYGPEPPLPYEPAQGEEGNSSMAYAESESATSSAAEGARRRLEEIKKRLENNRITRAAEMKATRSENAAQADIHASELRASSMLRRAESKQTHDRIKSDVMAKMDMNSYN